MSSSNTYFFHSLEAIDKHLAQIMIVLNNRPTMYVVGLPNHHTTLECHWVVMNRYIRRSVTQRKGGHTTVLDFFNSQKESDPQQLVQVKSWVSQAFDLSEDVSVMITQLQCTEEGCPPIETVIAIMETPGKPRQYKIHKPLAEVEQTDIVSLTAG